MPINRQFRLAARPIGTRKPSDWTLTEEPILDLDPAGAQAMMETER